MGSSASPPPPAWHDDPPKPARPIPLRERVKLQDGVIGHFHDHDDDYLLERRSRRKRAPKPEGPEGFDWEAFFKALTLLPPPLPRSKTLCILSLWEEAPEEPA